MKRVKLLDILLVVFISMIVAGCSFGNTKKLVFSAGTPIRYQLEGPEHIVVQTALDLFANDLSTVLQAKLETNSQSPQIVICTLPPDSRDPLAGKSQGFRIEEKGGTLYVTGADAQGTAYGIMELSRMLGVSPWVWWADSTPPSLDEWTVAGGFYTEQSPAVEYRGIFINDEDCGLCPWSWKTFDPSDVKGRIGPKTHEKIFELLLRLRANVFWPAMHGCSVPFFLTEGNREMAEKFGIFIGTSHCEPMLRNTNGEWGRAGVGDYNYVTNKKNVYQFWEDRVKETVHTNGFYTLGMRGVHDTGMVGAETMDQQRATLQQIIHDQRGLLKKYVNEDVTKVPQVFIPYKEVLPIYKSGLEVPEDVTLMWCDDNYGYIRHLPTEKERIRKGGNGIYYHFSYLGRPQTQLWLPSTCPSLAQTELERAYRHGIQKLWVFNAGDIKPNEFLIEYGLDMAWDRDILMNRNSGEYMAKWLEREFGEELGKDLVYVWKEYYDLTYQCRAEFLGHTRIEEQDPRYKVISDLPWSDKKVKSYLDKAVKMEEEMLQLREKVKKEDKAHWFEFVEYPCSSLAAMARKMLVSQLARHGKMAWDEAVEGQKKIWSLTEEYHTLLDGKWNHMMGLWKWHRLFDEVDTTRSSLPVMVPEDKNDYILTAKNGKMGSESYIIEGLGYSNCALALKKDDTFSIDIPSSADSLDIMFAFVPNHPVDSDRLEVRVEIEGEKAQYIRYETQGRSEEWKQNIERNQALRSIKIPASSHKRAMKLTATTPAVVLDEIIITE